MQEEQRKWKKAAKLKAGKRERAAKATESPSDCTYTLACLQIYSTSFFYFSPLFFRSSDLSFYCSPPGRQTAKPRPPTLCSPPNNSSILFLHSLSFSSSSLFPRLHRGLTSDRHVTTLVPEQTSFSLTYHRWIHKSFGTEISIQALLLLDAGHIFFDALTSVKSRS